MRSMVLAAVDDLMFASRIATAAKQLGVEVVFARTPEEVRRVAATQPTLAIFDLNCRRTEPLATLAALKSDPACHAIKTLGFVSHVQGDLVAAARKAGFDEVLARSAFTDRLGEILLRDRE
jgi:PleD family two-component response regulator